MYGSIGGRREEEKDLVQNDQNCEGSERHEKEGTMFVLSSTFSREADCRLMLLSIDVFCCDPSSRQSKRCADGIDRVAFFHLSWSHLENFLCCSTPKAATAKKPKAATEKKAKVVKEKKAKKVRMRICFLAIERIILKRRTLTTVYRHTGPLSPRPLHPSRRRPPLKSRLHPKRLRRKKQRLRRRLLLHSSHVFRERFLTGGGANGKVVVVKLHPRVPVDASSR
jgi:hypothetical protein